MGKSCADAEGYAKEVTLADFEKPGERRRRAEAGWNDLAAAGKPTEGQTIRKQAERLMTEAKTQLMAETK